jgi:rhodanese-related sulfurtransferase
MSKHIILIYLVFFVLSFGCKPKIQPKYTETIDVNQADSIIAANREIILVDVRTPEEYNEGSIPKALNIDVENDSFNINIANLDTLNTYLIFCRSGSRSLLAIEQLEASGFRYLYNMDGGYLEWSEKNNSY